LPETHEGVKGKESQGEGKTVVTSSDYS